jgi:hypothetical protein
MLLTKTLRNLIVAIIAICLLIVAFFFLTISNSKPVSQPLIYGEGQKAEKADFANCVILNKNQAILITEGSKDTLGFDQILPYVQNKRQSVGNSTFNIIVTPDTDFGVVKKTLDACSISQLQDYRLLEM